MTKTGRLFIVGMLVLLFTSAGSAFAHTSSSLNGTTWTGQSITLITAGGTATSTITFSITFTFESSTSYPGFLAGTFSQAGGDPIAFSALRSGNSLSIAAEGYIIHADIVYPFAGRHRGTTTPPTMQIRGKNLTDGSQFVGALTQSTL
jgi:hypothetical protein